MSSEFPLEFIKADNPLNEVLEDLDMNFQSFMDGFSEKVNTAKDEYDYKCDKMQKKLKKLNDVASKKIDEVIFNGLNDILEERNLNKLNQYMEIDPNKAFDGQSIPSQATLLSFVQQVSVLLNSISDKLQINRCLNWLEVVFDNLDESDPIMQCFLNPVLDTLLPSIQKLSVNYSQALLIHHFIRNIKNLNRSQ